MQAYTLGDPHVYPPYFQDIVQFDSNAYETRRTGFYINIIHQLNQNGTGEGWQLAKSLELGHQPREIAPYHRIRQCFVDE